MSDSVLSKNPRRLLTAEECVAELKQRGHLEGVEASEPVVVDATKCPKERLFVRQSIFRHGLTICGNRGWARSTFVAVQCVFGPFLQLSGGFASVALEGCGGASLKVDADLIRNFCIRAFESDFSSFGVVHVDGSLHETFSVECFTKAVMFGRGFRPPESLSNVWCVFREVERFETFCLPWGRYLQGCFPNISVRYMGRLSELA